MKYFRKNNGITLIALVITIIVMLILVAVTINIVAQGGLFDSASEATFKTELSKLQEELEIYKMTKLTEFGEKFEATSLTASTSRLYYDPVGETEGNIEEVMPSISEKMKKKIEVLNGEILFLGSEKEIKWAKEK